MSALAPDFTAHPANSRGLALGDIDNDGDIDLLVATGGGVAQLFRNDAPKHGHWLTVRAFDGERRRDAIGATVIAFVGATVLHRVIGAGRGYLSSHDLRAHFGLGRHPSVDSLVVHWPGGRSETFEGGAVDVSRVLERGRSTLR